jgi:acetyltransferase
VLVTGILDWAKSRGIGFSRFISLGDSADVDFGDVLDYLASDPDTHAVLLYMEDIRHARKFMSAARRGAQQADVDPESGPGAGRGARRRLPYRCAGRC